MERTAERRPDEEFLLNPDLARRGAEWTPGDWGAALRRKLDITEFKFSCESAFSEAQKKSFFAGGKAEMDPGPEGEQKAEAEAGAAGGQGAQSDPRGQGKPEGQFKRGRAEEAQEAEPGMSLFYIDNQNRRRSRAVTNPELRKLALARSDIPNAYSVADKRRFFERHREAERLDYVASYGAIQMQRQNERDFERKTHITKMKGAHGQISLKRSFGVSFVKARESFQKDVAHIFEPLPRLVIQDSKHCRVQRGLLGAFAASIEADFFAGSEALNLGFLMRSPAETGFREYLGEPARQLQPPFFERHFFFDRMESLAQCFEHEFFLSLFLDCRFLRTGAPKGPAQAARGGIRSHNCGARKPLSPAECARLARKVLAGNKLKLCFYSKKSLNSKKCFLKSVPYKLPPAVQSVFFQRKRRARPPGERAPPAKRGQAAPFSPQIVDFALQSRFRPEQEPRLNAYVKAVTGMTLGNFNTLSVKMEAFVDEAFWKGLSRAQQSVVFTYVFAFKLKAEEFLFFQGLRWFEFRERRRALRAQSEALRQFLSGGREPVSDSGDSARAEQRLAQVSEILAEHSPEGGDPGSAAETKAPALEARAKAAAEALGREIEGLNTGQVGLLHSQLKGLWGLGEGLRALVVERFTKKLNSQKAVAPYYLVNTRDCFMFDLEKRSREIDCGGRRVVENRYFFREGDTPSNFRHFEAAWPGRDTGVVTFENFFSHAELLELENCVDRLEDQYYRGAFLANTGQSSLGARNIKRTKFFFGARYIWHAQQLADPHSNVAGGVRVDTSEVPLWMRRKLLAPLVGGGLVDKGFINSIALNIYHDGEEGLAQHFDDAVRFKQPIFTLRVFSDARLSFGSQLYSFCNGAFCVDLPRGAVCVMLENGYAANGIKHCIRPVDMTGKSAAFILRQMHKEAVRVARKYDWLVDFPLAFQTLSLDPRAVAYWRQQRVLEKRGAAVVRKRGPKKKVKRGTGGAPHTPRAAQRRPVKVAKVLDSLDGGKAGGPPRRTAKRKRRAKRKKARGAKAEPGKTPGQGEARGRAAEESAPSLIAGFAAEPSGEEGAGQVSFPTFMDSCEQELFEQAQRSLEKCEASESRAQRALIMQNLSRLRKIEREIQERQKTLHVHQMYLNRLYMKEMQLKEHQVEKRDFLLGKNKYERDKVALLYSRKLAGLGEDFESGFK